MFKLRGVDVLSLQELSSEDIESILNETEKIKHEYAVGKPDESLRGKVLGMIFQKPSTRTRISFEVAMKHLGGYAIYLNWNEIQLGRGETISDTAHVLDRYVHAIVARVFSHKDIVELANCSKIPVINGLSDMYHPCQILADLFTVKEKKGRLSRLKLAYIGDGNNVCNTLLTGCAKVGMNISVASPLGYEPHVEAVEHAKIVAEENGSYVQVANDPKLAAENADIIYTDTFVSMGMESDREERLRTFLPKYQVTEQIMQKAGEKALFMHCLPAHREEEVTSQVIDGPRSIVWDQAENRLHAQKALLKLILQ